ncbi:sugar phosphate isomerase/epimerase family protein [Rubritalea tangerina]|uniref:Sugar phosphate isomerase/epimerase family protein n=1 Tax=Rubritalea tangerina TaxID=430798 RepID=A0ABW4ZDZ4_9BACT
MIERREFILGLAQVVIAGAMVPRVYGAGTGDKLFDISLAEWSLHRTIHAGKLDNLDFPRYAKEEFGIGAVEYVNGFFYDKAKDKSYLGELKKRAADVGVENVLIMVDREGHMGGKTRAETEKTVERHKKWVEAAKFLGCHSIRVNAHGHGGREEAGKRVAEGLRLLSEFAEPMGVNVLVENHGGLSSDGAWLAGVLKSVGMKNCGSLPDFGNFHSYDRYQGLRDLMPFAMGVSAKSRVFDADGNEAETDFRKAMEIVLASGFKGYVGIEWEGGNISEQEGIRKTLALLEKVRSEMLAQGGK